MDRQTHMKAPCLTRALYNLFQMFFCCCFRKYCLNDKKNEKEKSQKEHKIKLIVKAKEKKSNKNKTYKKKNTNKM